MTLKARFLLLFLVAGGVILIDQLSKYWILENLCLYETISPIPFLDPFFRITHSYNTGIAFGMLADAGDLFQYLVGFVMIGLVIYYIVMEYDTLPFRLALSLVIGGGIGNLIDRAQHGYVVDFVHFTIGPISNISNIADHAVVIGIIVMLIESIRMERLAKQNTLDSNNTNLDS